MIEKQILQGLIQDEEYVRQVLPFLKQDYFTQLEHGLIYNVISEYFDKYNALPKVSALANSVRVGCFIVCAITLPDGCMAAL